MKFTKESVKKIIWDFIDNNNYHDETYASGDDDNLFEMFDDYYNMNIKTDFADFQWE